MNVTSSFVVILCTYVLTVYFLSCPTNCQLPVLTIILVHEAGEPPFLANPRPAFCSVDLLKGKS